MLHNEEARVGIEREINAEAAFPFGFSVVVSDATLARVTIVESPIHIATLSTLAVRISISAYHHSSKSTKR